MGGIWYPRPSPHPYAPPAAARRQRRHQTTTAGAVAAAVAAAALHRLRGTRPPPPGSSNSGRLANRRKRSAEDPKDVRRCGPVRCACAMEPCTAARAIRVVCKPESRLRSAGHSSQCETRAGLQTCWWTAALPVVPCSHISVTNPPVPKSMFLPCCPQQPCPNRLIPCPLAALPARRGRALRTRVGGRSPPSSCALCQGGDVWPRICCLWVGETGNRKVKVMVGGGRRSIRVRAPGRAAAGRK
jgi:hypothetical protein